MKLNRNTFLNKKTIKKGDKHMLLLPIDFVFLTKYKYTELCVIGITETGHKCVLKIMKYPIFTDILLDSNKLQEDLLENKYDFEKIQMLPGKGFNRPQTYGRVYFNKISERMAFIKKYSSKGFTLANDDVKYELLLYRYTSISTCSWNVITGFMFASEYNNSGAYPKVEIENVTKLPVQIVIKNISQMKAYNSVIHKHISVPEKDNSIVCSFDLETFTTYKYGRVPLPEYPEDCIKMCAMSFRFYWDTKPFLWVLITAIPVSESFIYSQCPFLQKPNGVKIILTQDITEAIADVLEGMQPDFISGYNCGSYDWPFVKKRTTDSKVFLNKVSALMLGKYDYVKFGPMEEKNNFNKPKAIKIDAETTAVYNGYTYPGCVCFDTMIVMRKRDKTETSWSLNTFLKKYGLSEKYDMSYTKMAQIFRLYELTTQDSITEPNKIYFPEDIIMGGNAISHLTGADIIELLKQADHVGLYCLKDAEAVQNLLYKLCVIQDIREVGNLSYTTTRDGFYRADGMKVCNCLLYDSHKPEWGIWPEKYPLAFSLYKEYKPVCKTDAKVEKYKYPGAYVLSPKKGIYGKTAIEKLLANENTGAIVDPQNTNFNKNIIAEIKQKNIKPDRPNAGLDFSSLYPSLIMCYNFSPEYYVENETIFRNDYEELSDILLLEINTLYKRESDLKCDNLRKKGYFIQQKSEKINNEYVYTNHGIFPTILRKLFAMRKQIKQDMSVWATIVEKLTRDIQERDLTLPEIINKLNEKINNIRNYCKDFKGYKLQLELNKIKNYENAIAIISQKWETYPSYKELYNVAIFKYNYYNTKQTAVKVFMNTFYGEMGNPNSPFFIITMSGGVTKMGRKALKCVKSYLDKLDFNIFYGDSVTGETPLLLKINDVFYIKTISALFNMFTLIEVQNEKEYVLINTKVEAWTEKGWTKVNNIMRHKTNKKIYRVLTHTGYVEVTEDHSLISEKGDTITPKNIYKDNNVFLMQSYPVNNTLKKTDTYNIYVKSQLEAAQYYYKIKRSGYNVSITYNKKGFVLTYGSNSYTKPVNKIKKIELLSENTDIYVYDLTTENHHFQAGIGDIIVHNTDSLYISPPEAAFSEIDLKYYEGFINKETYFEEMVGITMNTLREISISVADMLEQRNGNPFLKMEYEEVLFPFGFVGKKNYFGIKHINSIDFSICKLDSKNEKHREVFKKELFSRGLPLRRRDGSPFTKKLLLETLMQFCALYETRSYEQIIYDKIKEEINNIAIYGSDYYKLLLKNYSFREPRENSHTVQMTYRERMIEYYLHEQINRAIYYIKQNDDTGIYIINKILNEKQYDIHLDKVAKYYNLNLHENINLHYLKKLYENYVVDEHLLKLNFNIPVYGSRVNLLVLNKPSTINNKGSKETFSTGNCLDEEKFINNYNYKMFLINLYAKKGIKIIDDTDIMSPCFRVYFAEFFGKLARFMLYLPVYNSQIIDKCQELTDKKYNKNYKKCTYTEVFEDPENVSKCKRHIFKNIIKDAESAITKKIKTDLEKKYKQYFPDIKCDSSKLKEDYKLKRKEILSVIGTGVFINNIIDFVTTECSLQVVENTLIRYLEQKFIVNVYINVKALPNYAFKDMTRIQKQNAEYKKRLLGKLRNLCTNLKLAELIDLSDYFSEIKQLNTDFKNLVKRIALEKEITRAVNNKPKIRKSMIVSETKYKPILDLELGNMDFEGRNQDIELDNFINF